MKPTALALALAAALAAPSVHAEEDLRETLKSLAAEVSRLRAEVAELKHHQTETPTREEVAKTVDAGVERVRESAGESPTRIFGYGEIGYTMAKDRSQSQASVGRMVLGIGHSFDDRTKFVGELEVEHAVVSASDKGEFEVEQAYVEHRLSDALAVKGGLFLMPIGLINESHEPPNYYGVNRNLVETAIIPSTWREIGVGFTGNTEAGLRWDAGLTTGFDLSKWDATDAEAKDGPLRVIHQEGSLAKAHDLSGYVSLNYNGVPGLNVGGSVFYGGIGQGQKDFAARNAHLVLAEGHARWTPGKWDLAVLYAEGRIGGVSDFNLTLVGNPYPVPKRFSGGYVQAAYTLWQSGEMSLLPFARFERFNTAQSYDDALAAFGYSALPTERVITAGASFKLLPQVVIKADYQRFAQDRGRDAFNLGLGFSY